MSQNRKNLKLVSFAQVLLGLVAIVLGVLGISVWAGTEGLQPALGLDADTIAVVAAVLKMIAGALAIASAAGGIKGANRPRNLGIHLPVSIVAVVVALAAFALPVAASNLGTSWVCAAVAVFDIAAAALDRKVLAELDH